MWFKLMRFSILTFSCLLAFSAVFCFAVKANGQSSSLKSVSTETEKRISDIYERNLFQARRIQAEWLADSSGFLASRIDPSTGSPSKRFFDAKSGQSSEPTTNQLSLPVGASNVSPDRLLTLESKHRELGVRSMNVSKPNELQDYKILLKAPENRDIRYREMSWSPDGKHILFLESDMTDVPTRQVLVSEDPSYPRIENHRFARVGEKIESLRVGVIPSQGGDVKWLDLQVPDQGIYLGQLAWAGNSTEVLVEKFSRFRDRRDILLFELDGDSKSIFSESSDSWVESSQGKITGIQWIKNGEAFVVVSEKDGWRHAYLYGRDGSELAVLTPGDYDVIDRGPVDEANGLFYFYASPENGTQRYLFSVPLDGSGSKARISPENQPGTHQYQFAPNAKSAVHTYSTLDSPPVVELVELPVHNVVKVLEDNSVLKDRMKSIINHPTEFLRLDIGNGFQADTWMIKPKDFDPSKKYPVFIYVYGEPHAQTVLDEWGTSQIDFHRAIADLGYLVVSFDNRGTPAPKGATWRRAVFGSLGPLSTEEQEAALKSLGRKYEFVDLSRVGIWGWSGGGSNTLNAMFRKPDSYHVGIAVVPKPQPHLYNAWFQEIFMRDQTINPDGYEKAAAINYAEGLKGRLLIITGSGETNTHIQIIEGLVDRLIELGKPFDYWVYPNRDHGLREGMGTVVHVRLLIIRYLVNNLKPGPSD
jgi:dipeptidyl-peptidase-4